MQTCENTLNNVLGISSSHIVQLKPLSVDQYKKINNEIINVTCDNVICKIPKLINDVIENIKIKELELLNTIYSKDTSSLEYKHHLKHLNKFANVTRIYYSEDFENKMGFELI